jgi:hypothetical protein
MPERAINTKSATGCLLVLIPAALTMSALFVAWPVILGVTLLIAGGNVWQSYEWSKTAQSIDPIFQQLIVQNRGEISPIDLSLRANVSGKVSQRYLATRADEFGTGSRQHPDRGQVYYFVSISTLGSIFDDSERELELPAIAPAATPVVAFQEVATPIAAIPEELVPTATIPPIARAIPIATASVEPISPPAIPLPLDTGAGLSNLRQLFDEEPAPTTTLASVERAVVTEPILEPVAEVAPTTILASVERAVVTEPIPEPVAEVAPGSLPDTPMVTIIQSELAKRLDVHSSTIYKRRSEPDFTDWTRNRDPEGLAWGYAEAAKEYYRIDT